MDEAEDHRPSSRIRTALDDFLAASARGAGVPQRSGSPRVVACRAQCLSGRRESRVIAGGCRGRDYWGGAQISRADSGLPLRPRSCSTEGSGTAVAQSTETRRTRNAVVQGVERKQARERGGLSRERARQRRRRWGIASGRIAPSRRHGERTYAEKPSPTAEREAR